MKNKDLIKQQLMTDLSMALKSNDESAVAESFTKYAESVQQSIMEDIKAYERSADNEILQRRGVHTLTQKEEKFYNGIIDAMKSEDPRQAFTGVEVALPETVIDNIISDIKTAHPLLAEISFVNTTALTKILVNKKGAQLAKWGALNSAIVQELEGTIGKIDLTLCKLSAFMPISKDMLSVGPQWMDAYVRETLSEACALALETAIVNGTGKDEPIGMNRDVSDNVTITGGVYPKKEAVKLVSFEPKEYGDLIAKLAVGPNGKPRAVSKVILVVNPLDYFTKVFPATTVRSTNGTFNGNVFPFPTTVIQSCGVTQGEAVLGLSERYFMGIGKGTNGGKIEFSDEYKFLEDERMYLIKLYGNGRALDNNAFLLLDITGLVPANITVEVQGVVKTKEQA